MSLASGISALRTLNGDREFNITAVMETAAGSCEHRRLPFRIVRRPGFFQLFQPVRESDIIHVAGPALFPMFLAWTLRKRFVVEHHGYQAICPNGILLHPPDRSIRPGYFQSGRYGECFKCLKSELLGGWVAARLLLLMFPRNWLSPAASVNLAIKNHVSDRHKLRRTNVVYYGIEDPLPNCSASVKSQKLCIAYVGPEKGVPVLLEAAKTLQTEGHDFEARLIGDASERPELENIIHADELEFCATITGFLTGHASATALQDVNVVAMPSMWEKTAGLAAMEQMIGRSFGQSGRHWRLIRGGWRHGVKIRSWRRHISRKLPAQRSVILNVGLIEFYGQKARKRPQKHFQRSRMIAELKLWDIKKE